MSSQQLLLIDGFNLLSRGYFATSYGKEESQLATNKNGEYINGVRVFFQKLFQLIKNEPYTHAIIAWDVKREESIRRQYAPDYKGTRGELPTPLIEQYETCTKLLDKLQIHQLTLSPYEADDIIGTISSHWRNHYQAPCSIYSNDRDLLQLINESTVQIIAKKAGEVKYDLESFQNDYALSPSQWVDVKALLGDKSDNIPGCAGVGEKSALPLIQQYENIDTLYENLQANTVDTTFKRYFKKLSSGYESVLLSKKLATIICDIPHLEDFNFEDCTLPVNKEEIENILTSYGLSIKYQPLHLIAN
ncbi:exonuclease [Bacillus sp. TS-2]|nr:exonuclease [Bacillus sp. TS-2]